MLGFYAVAAEAVDSLGESFTPPVQGPGRWRAWELSMPGWRAVEIWPKPLG